MYANYHTHTYRCGHASGTEREYIEKAIKSGITILGFSDHAPLKLSDGTESGYRVPTALAEDYIETLRNLRDEYKDKIKIYIGFEMEYYPKCFDIMLEYVKNLGAEYLILGEHFIENESGGALPCSAKTNDEARLAEYADCIIAGMKTGKFLYVAHPDIINFQGNQTARERDIRRICVASHETGVPLEINFLGIRDKRYYPADDFIRIAGEEESPIVFGLDAHDAQSIPDAQSLEIAMKKAEIFGLRVVNELEIKNNL